MNKKILIIVAGVMVLAIFASIIWYKLVRREVPQPGWITATERDNFLYGSVGAERDAGIQGALIYCQRPGIGIETPAIRPNLFDGYHCTHKFACLRRTMAKGRLTFPV